MKKKVLKIKPGAFAWSWADYWVIYEPTIFNGNVHIADGKTPAQAWAAAYRKLRARAK